MKLGLKDLFKKPESELQTEIESGFKTASMKYDFRDKTLKIKNVASDMFMAGVNFGLQYASENQTVQPSEPIQTQEPVVTVEEAQSETKPGFNPSSVIDVIINWVKFEIHNNFKCHMTVEREKMLRKMLENLLIK